MGSKGQFRVRCRAGCKAAVENSAASSDCLQTVSLHSFLVVMSFVAVLFFSPCSNFSYNSRGALSSTVRVLDKIFKKCSIDLLTSTEPKFHLDVFKFSIFSAAFSTAMHHLQPSTPSFSGLTEGI